MSVPAGRFICALCEQTIETLIPTSEAPICRSRKHLNSSVMVRVVATAAERKRKSRKRKVST